MSKLKFLEKILGRHYYSSSTREAVFKCPFCKHHKNKLSINIDTDRYQCWVCGKGSYSLYPILKQFGTREDLAEYNKLYKSKTVKEKKLEDDEEIFRLYLPKGFMPIISNLDSTLGNRAYNYLTKKRGLTKEQILYYKIGTCTHGDHFGKIVFPSFDCQGNVNYYIVKDIETGRYTTPFVPKGYRNKIVINELNIDWSLPVILVEGYFDAIKTENTNVVPLSGSLLSKYSLLYQKIIENKSRVVLALDADAEDKTNKMAKKFLQADIDVGYVNVKPYSDVGEMPAGAFTKKYEEATMLDEMSVLRRRFRMEI